MATLKADDDVHRLAYIWYGPKLDGFLSIVRFKGRVLSEWALLVPLFVLLWQLAGGFVSGNPLTVLVLRFSIAWGGGSFLAKLGQEKLIDADRTARYVLRCVVVEGLRAVRSRMPVDRAALLVGVVAWWVLAKLGVALLPSQALLVWVLAVPAAVGVARRIVHRLESAGRAWRRLHARLARSARPFNFEVSP